MSDRTRKRRRRGTHIKANAPSTRLARDEAAKLATRPARGRVAPPIDFWKLALTVDHDGGPEVLRAQAQEVPLPLTQVVHDICARMIEVTRRDPHCLGIAAPQVNRSLRIFTVKDNDGMVYCFINPTVTPMPGADVVPEVEGCFSLPGRQVMVERATAVEVEGVTPFNGESKVVFTGTAARAAQHELDHLQGVLIDDHGTVTLVGHGS